MNQIVPALTICTLLLSGCGVVNVDNACAEIRKKSTEKRQLGSALVGKALAGEVSEGLSVNEVEAMGYKYLMEGINLVIDNSQCFSSEEVKQAESIINP